MRKGRDFMVSECGDAMSYRGRLRLPRSFLGVLKGLAGLLFPRQVILLSLHLANPMGMRGPVMQFGCLLVVFVVRPVVISIGHIKYSYLP